MTYNRCPDCGKTSKRYMPLGDKKVCRDCYEEYAIDTFIAQEAEYADWKLNNGIS